MKISVFVIRTGNRMPNPTKLVQAVEMGRRRRVAPSVPGVSGSTAIGMLWIRTSAFVAWRAGAGPRGVVMASMFDVQGIHAPRCPEPDPTIGSSPGFRNAGLQIGVHGIAPPECREPGGDPGPVDGGLPAAIP